MNIHLHSNYIDKQRTMTKKSFIVLTISVAFSTIFLVTISPNFRRKKVPLYMKEILGEVYIEKNDVIKPDVDIDADYAQELKEKSDYHFKKYIVESLPKKDFKKLINLDFFEFSVPEKQCVNSTFILILVFSSVENFKVRNTIRKSWGQRNKNVTTLFVLGYSENSITQKAIIEENSIHMDIIQGGMLDSDKTYIYKYVMGLKYALYFCPHAHYIVKINDDIYINVPILKRFLVRKFEECGATDLIQCSTEVDPSVDLNEETANGKPVSNLYCTNHAVIFTWDVVFRLYQLAQESEFYGNHEAFITGKLAREFNIQHKDIKNYIIDFNMLDEIIFSSGIEGKRHFIFGPAGLETHLMTSMWDVIGHIDTSDVVLPNEQC